VKIKCSLGVYRGILQIELSEVLRMEPSANMIAIRERSDLLRGTRSIHPGCIEFMMTMAEEDVQNFLAF
jgi:hypothetical protein